jgi:hypothetical protein
MTVSALVLTLSPDPVVRASVLDRLRADPRLTVGQRVLDRLPVVAETASCAEGSALVEALDELDGVVRIDVIAIDFSEAV